MQCCRLDFLFLNGKWTRFLVDPLLGADDFRLQIDLVAVQPILWIETGSRSFSANAAGPSNQRRLESVRLPAMSRQSRCHRYASRFLTRLAPPAGPYGPSERTADILCSAVRRYIFQFNLSRRRRRHNRFRVAVNFDVEYILRLIGMSPKTKEVSKLKFTDSLTFSSPLRLAIHMMKGLLIDNDEIRIHNG